MQLTHIAPAARRLLTDAAAPLRYKNAALGALQGQPHIYGGTVAPAVVARRRAANKVARRSRRVNRMRARS